MAFEEMKTSEQNNYWQRNGTKGETIRLLRDVMDLISVGNVVQL
jgi:hypothetical protein